MNKKVTIQVPLEYSREKCCVDSDEYCCQAYRITFCESHWWDVVHTFISGFCYNCQQEEYIQPTIDEEWDEGITNKKKGGKPAVNYQTWKDYWTERAKDG